MVRLSTNVDEYSDMLLFSATGIGPCTRPANFAADSKGDVRDAVRLQYAHKTKVNPLRLKDLGEDMDNLPIVAMKLGYNLEWLSPQMRVMWEQVRLRHSSAMTNITPADVSATPRRGQRRPALALADASADASPTTPIAAPGAVTPVARRQADRIIDVGEPAVLPAEPVAAWSVPVLRLPRLPGRRNAVPIAPAGDGDDFDGVGLAAAPADIPVGGDGGVEAEIALNDIPPLFAGQHVDDVGSDHDESPRHSDDGGDGGDRSVDID